MFKIEITDRGRIYKKKFYESAKQYNKWLKKHRKSYGTCNVTGYRLESEEWIKNS